MIIFEGIKPTTGSVSILKFSNELGAIVEIPVENSIATLLSLHLSKISSSSTKTVERGNEELSE